MRAPVLVAFVQTSSVSKREFPSRQFWYDGLMGSGLFCKYEEMLELGQTNLCKYVSNSSRVIVGSVEGRLRDNFRNTYRKSPLGVVPRWIRFFSDFLHEVT